MKIKSIYISSFGGVKDLRLDLEDNFTVIFGENEQGKTTVMNFIKMMFYGTERAKGDLSKSPRKKYTPWDQSQMAGSIDFTEDGKNFRLERIFGDSNSTDKVTLINTDLGSRETVSADIGAKLFGLSAAAFERSIFIGQFGFPESNQSAEGEINSKLSNIALTGSEDTSFDEVYTRLEKAKLQLSSKSGRTGAYDKNLISLKDLNERLSKAEAEAEKINIGRQKASEIIKEIDLLQTNAAKLKEKLDKEQDFKNADKLHELLTLKDELEAVTKELTIENGNKIDEMFLKKIDFCLSKITGVKTKIDAKENENKIIKQSLDLALNPTPDITPEKAEKIKQKITALEDNKEQITKKLADLTSAKPPKRTAFFIFLIIAIISAICGILLLTQNIIWGFASLFVSVIFGIADGVSFIKHSHNIAKFEQDCLDLKDKYNQLISEIATEKANFSAINTALNTTAQMVEKQQKLFDCNIEAIEILNKEKAVLDCELSDLLGNTFDNADSEEISKQLEIFSLKAQQQKEIKQKINYILKDVGNISYESATEKIKAAEGFEITDDFDKIKDEYQKIQERITEQKTITAEILTEIKAITKVMENPESIKNSIVDLTQKTESQKRYLDALNLAMATLSDSFAEVRRNYGSVLDSKTAEIFKGITGGKYKSVNVSKSFDISVEKADTFGSFEIGYLSSGTVDQAYLSLRLALSEFIADTNESLPIMLDDSLAQFDDNRTKTALEFLKKYAAENQIIMFTCHKSISDTAEALGGKKLYL